jgi:hypothetical protein
MFEKELQLIPFTVELSLTLDKAGTRGGIVIVVWVQQCLVGQKHQLNNQ